MPGFFTLLWMQNGNAMALGCTYWPVLSCNVCGAHVDVHMSLVTNASLGYDQGPSKSVCHEWGPNYVHLERNWQNKLRTRHIT